MKRLIGTKKLSGSKYGLEMSVFIDGYEVKVEIETDSKELQLQTKAMAKIEETKTGGIKFYGLMFDPDDRTSGDIMFFNTSRARIEIPSMVTAEFGSNGEQKVAEHILNHSNKILKDIEKQIANIEKKVMGKEESLNSRLSNLIEDLR